MNGPWYPLGVAMGVADGLRDALADVCERVEIAGSVRRQKPKVGDVEIVYAPRYREIRDMFGEVVERVDLVAERLEAMLDAGQIEKRPDKLGRYAWGDKNKLARDPGTGLAIDLFATTLEGFENYLVCRTGPGLLNIEIAERARKKGWKWNPYGRGFSQVDSMGAHHVHVVNAEADVFRFVGLPAMGPVQRRRWEKRGGMKQKARELGVPA